MSEHEFRRLHLGEWKPSPKLIALEDALTEYYKTSESLDNREAARRFSHIKRCARHDEIPHSTFSNIQHKVLSKLDC